MTHILLTGASGFLGQPLHAALQNAGYVAYPLTCRLDDEAGLRRECNGMEMVIHCAAELRDRAKMHHTNVLGTIYLGYAAKKTGVKVFVHIGTASTRFHTTYGITKRHAEESIIRIGELTGLKVIVVRPPTLYGGHRGPKWLQGLKLLFMGRPLRLQSREECVQEIMQAAGL